MCLRKLLAFFTITLLYSSTCSALLFCMTNNGDERYYPLFTIDQHHFFNQYQYRLKCEKIPDTLIANKTFLTLKTNGFDVDYRNNILAIAATFCGDQKACEIPLIYKKQHLDYIHVTVWPKDNSMTGVLSAIYR